MAFELTNAHQVGARPALKYDANSVKLLGCFHDELSAYRTRRQWMQILAEHFMLEKERDYDIAIEHDSEGQNVTYSLAVTFTSACGRYAFWRLVNRHAPEVENELGIRSNKLKKQNEKLLSAIFGEAKQTEPSWVIKCKNDKKSFSDILGEALKKFSCLMF